MFALIGYALAVFVRCYEYACIQAHVWEKSAKQNYIPAAAGEQASRIPIGSAIKFGENCVDKNL